MDRVELLARATSGQPVGQGAPATAADVAALAGPLLAASTSLPPDVVLRSGLVWPVLQHAAWLWRVAGPDEEPTLHWALLLQLRADLFGFLELGLAAYELGRTGAAAGRAYPGIVEALSMHVDDGDDLTGLPPTLPTDTVLPLAARRWALEDIPGDLLVKCQLFTAVTYARLDGFSGHELMDVFAAVLDELAPLVLRSQAPQGPV